MKKYLLFIALVIVGFCLLGTPAQAGYIDYISVNLAQPDPGTGTVAGGHVGGGGAAGNWINMSGYTSNANYAASADGSGWTSGVMSQPALTANGLALGSFRVDLYDGGWGANSQWNDAGNPANTLGRSGMSNGDMPNNWGPTGCTVALGNVPVAFQTAGYDVYALMGPNQNSGAGLAWIKLNAAPVNAAGFTSASFPTLGMRSLAAIQVAAIGEEAVVPEPAGLGLIGVTLLAASRFRKRRS